MTKQVKTNLRTAIYVRVSTEEQVQEGYSIRGQSEKLKHYALLKEWDIYNIYSDEGISGKNIEERPAITQLIEDIKNGKVNNVLVFRVDRLTRNTKNLIELVELFEENDCAFNSLTESIDTDTPSGRMFLKIIGIFAEFERENLATRLKLGFERKAKEGYTLASHCFSYGYIRKKGEKTQEIQPEEARIVKEIFAMYVDENMTMTKIAKILNERKIKTKNNGKTWCSTAIRRILENPNYIGKVRYSIRDKERYFEADGHHEKILSEEIFLLAQKKMERLKKISSTKLPKEEQYFCGILVCGLCGSKFGTHHKNNIRKSGEKQRSISYRCRNKIYYNNDIACKNPSIHHDKMEEAFIEYIKKINDFTGTENINLENKKLADKKREQQEYITILESKLENIQNRKKQVMEQYISEEITFEEYKELLEISNQKHETLKNELQKLRFEISEEEPEDDISREDIIVNLKESWGYFDDKEKLMFLQKFVKKIVIVVEKKHATCNTVQIKEVVFNGT